LNRIAIALIALAVVSSPATAQSDISAPTVGAVGLRPPSADLPTFGASSGTDVLRHRSPIGAPCLTVAGVARPHAVNPTVFDHVITAKNSCAQRITIRICYYKSADCMPMEIPGGERKEAILGTLPAVKEFRFEFREKF